jgi:hypothetical protein
MILKEYDAIELAFVDQAADGKPNPNHHGDQWQT